MSNLLINTRVDVEVPDGLMVWLEAFSEFASQAKMGLHCSVCKQDIVSHKHFAGDVKLTMQCGCRNFAGINPKALLERRKAEKMAEDLKNGTAGLPVC